MNARMFFPGTGRKKWIGLGLSFIAPALLMLFDPLGMDARQNLVLAAFLLTVIWWVANLVERTAASVFLLAFFACVGRAPLRTVFSFPLSENFWTILLAFLFSAGIANSGLAEKMIQPVIMRFGNALWKLLLTVLAFEIALVFLIPQPISRVIILATIYIDFFDRLSLGRELKNVLLLGIFTFGALVNMMFRQGDIILNTALMSMAEVSIDGAQWARYMLAPTAALLVLSVGLYCLVFRKTLREYARADFSVKAARARLSRKEKANAALIFLCVLVWALEGVHGVSGTIVVTASVTLMFAVRILRREDLKSVNLRLMVFLTAAFSVGGTLKACGVAEILFSKFSSVFPGHFTPAYVAIALAVTLSLHMILGSNLTTMSVVVPGLMAIGAGVAPPVPLMFLICLAICGHYILPFHSLFMILGEGNGYFTTRQLVRFGFPNTALVFFSGLLLYAGYWALTSLL